MGNAELKEAIAKGWTGKPTTVFDTLLDEQRDPNASDAPKQLVTAAWSMPKEGKNHLWGTYPAPHFLLNLDFGWGAAARHTGIKPFITDFFLPATNDWKILEPFLARIEVKWKQYLEAANETGGTVCVDTATQVWQLMQDVEIGKWLDQMLSKMRTKDPSATENDIKNSQTKYAKANRRMNAFLRMPFLYPNANALYLNRASEIYDSLGKPTGMYRAQEFGDTGYIVEIAVKLFKQGTGDSAEYWFKVEKCRGSALLEGQSFPAPSYEALHELVFS